MMMKNLKVCNFVIISIVLLVKISSSEELNNSPYNNNDQPKYHGSLQPKLVWVPAEKTEEPKMLSPQFIRQKQVTPKKNFYSPTKQDLSQNLLDKLNRHLEMYRINLSESIDHSPNHRYQTGTNHKFHYIIQQPPSLVVKRPSTNVLIDYPPLVVKQPPFIIQQKSRVHDNQTPEKSEPQPQKELKIMKITKPEIKKEQPLPEEKQSKKFVLEDPKYVGYYMETI